MDDIECQAAVIGAFFRMYNYEGWLKEMLSLYLLHCTNYSFLHMKSTLYWLRDNCVIYACIQIYLYDMI